jgi:hypothetical protein
MANPLLNRRGSYSCVLGKAQELSEQVREIAERVHRQALETHRRTEIARQHSERGRELSRLSREEACAVKVSINWSLDAAQQSDRRRSGKPKE